MTLSPRATAPYGIMIKNQFGYVNVTNTQILNSGPSPFPNGTIVFNLAPSTSRGTIYSYLARSFGNGTFDLRFLTGGQKPTVTAQLSSSTSFLPSSNTQVIDYTANVASDPVILSFVGTASQQLFNAAVFASFLFGIIMATIGMLYTVNIVSTIRQGLGVASGRLEGENYTPAKTSVKLTIAGLAAVIGFGIMLIMVVYFGGVLQGMGF